MNDDINNYLENLKKVQSLKVERVSHFEYSEKAKIPYKVHSLVESLNCRMIDFCESIDSLIKTNHIIPAVSLIRSTFEVTAIIYRISSNVEKSVIDNKLTDNFDDLIMKLNFGTRYSNDYSAINIMTNIEKTDKAHYEFSRFYNELCEFVHPNWDGVLGSYSELNEIERNTLIFKTVTTQNQIYKWIEASFIISMDIYLMEANKLKLNIKNFAKICESELKI